MKLLWVTLWRTFWKLAVTDATGKFFRGVQFLFSTLSFFEWICGRSEHYLFLISFALMKIRDRMVSETRTQTEHLNFLGNKQESNWLKILVRGDNLMRRVVQIIYYCFNLWCVTVEYEIWTSFYQYVWGNSSKIGDWFVIRIIIRIFSCKRIVYKIIVTPYMWLKQLYECSKGANDRSACSPCWSHRVYCNIL